MRNVGKSACVTFCCLLASAVWAQQSSSSSVRDQRKAEARVEARNHVVGEGNPIPQAQPRATRAEKDQARKVRRQAGREEARDTHEAEGMPIPEPMAKVPRSERVSARAERKAESRRANKAGEITSKGESSY